MSIRKVGLELMLAAAIGLLGYIILGLSPTSFTVSGAGTTFNNIRSKQPYLAVVLGLLVLLTRFLRQLSIGLPRYKWTPANLFAANGIRRKFFSMAPLILVISLACLINLPESRRNSNSRIHWVDYRVGNRQDEWVYISTRILYRIFEIAPWALAGILAGGCGLMLRFLAKEVSPNIALYNLAPLALFAPGYSLSMMDLGEDVLVNNAFLLLSISLVILRLESPHFRKWLVLAVLLVISTRPPLLIGFTIFVAALRMLQSRRDLDFERQHSAASDHSMGVWRVLTVDFVASAATVMFHQLFFSAIGKSFVEVTLEGTGYFPIEVDSFLLSRFSGAFLGHGLWIYFPFLGLIFISVVSTLWVRKRANQRPLPDDIPSTTILYFGGGLLVGWVATLWTYDSVILPYFNIRYVHTAAPYMWGMIVIAAAHAHRAFLQPREVDARPSKAPNGLKESTTMGAFFLLLVLSLAVIGTRNTASAITDQQSSEFQFLSEFRGRGVETQFTFILLNKYDINEVERALMLPKSLLRVRDEVDCEEDQIFVIRQSEFLKQDENIRLTSSFYFPPGVVLFTCVGVQ